MIVVARDDWQTLRERFVEFFAGSGTVTTDDDQVVFDGSPAVSTQLVIRRDGTSASFMPLHGLESRWDRVVFDAAAAEVALEAEGVRYVYRVPPTLLSR